MSNDSYDATTDVTAERRIERTLDIVAAYVSNNVLPAANLPGLIIDVHAALAGLDSATATKAEPEVERQTPAAIKRSITHDALISFIDGKPYKMLRRHLTQHGLDPHSYRARFGLPADYPMTAPSYSEHRSELARATGLGQQRRTWPEKTAAE